MAWIRVGDRLVNPATVGSLSMEAHPETPATPWSVRGTTTTGAPLYLFQFETEEKARTVFDSFADFFGSVTVVIPS